MPYLASSSTKKTQSGNSEPNLLPMMNLMVVLIPVLLSAAEFIKIGMLEIDLPTSGGGGGSSSEETPQEVEQKLGLKLFVTKNGFTLANDFVVIKDSASDGGPTIPLKNGEYDFESLHTQLADISEKYGSKFKDGKSIKIAADSSIAFQTLVTTMDNARSTKVNGKTIVMFPQVNFGRL
ncbi:MAG: hypothetical protein DWQ06_06265 [Calditrichaeota bacterium]|nr:MAG: hypothetical protein DWQ06_06265 [Calditrichota bacterium]